MTQASDALWADPGYAALLGRVRRRLEQGGHPATMRLRGLDEVERTALADLLALPRRPGSDYTLRVADLSDALRRSRVGMGLVEVLQAHGGPLRDARADLLASRQAWVTFWDWATGEVAARDWPWGEAWLSYARGGVLARLSPTPAGARSLLEDAFAVLDRLPAEGTALALLATGATGDPHALDPGRPLSTLVLAAVASRRTGSANAPTGAGDRRDLWGTVGVQCDPLSMSVLVLGLVAAPTGVVGRAMTEHAEAGEPLRLTLRAVQDAGLVVPATDVFVCENPAVVAAAADEFGAACRPLVCVEGVPNTAADRLLGLVVSGSGSVRFHADFDGGGIRIGNLLAARHDASPWRFGAADYLAAMERLPVTTDLDGNVDGATWDERLAPALRRTCRIVYEEQVLSDLLADLGR